MQDYELAILEQYPINVKSTRKTRGAFFCDTDQGFLLLREAGISGKRLPALYKLYEHLRQQGYANVDQFVANRDGEYISTSEEGVRYVLKYWFHGRECDVRKSGEVMEAAKNLANLHRMMRLETEDAAGAGVPLKEEYVSHNREMKKIRKFIREQAPKGKFELAFLASFDEMYEWAQAALSGLDEFDCEQLYEDSV